MSRNDNKLQVTVLLFATYVQRAAARARLSRREITLGLSVRINHESKSVEPTAKIVATGASRPCAAIN